MDNNQSASIVDSGPSAQIAPSSFSSSQIMPSPKIEPHNPTVSTATNAALQSGAPPADLSLAKRFLGDHAYIGFCQAFVEQTQGKLHLHPTAVAAWVANQNRAVPGLAGVQPGDAIYFAPDASNEGAGHTGIYAGNDQFISATNSGIESQDLGQWQQQTGQRLLGYIRNGEQR